MTEEIFQYSWRSQLDRNGVVFWKETLSVISGTLISTLNLNTLFHTEDEDRDDDYFFHRNLQCAVGIGNEFRSTIKPVITTEDKFDTDWEDFLLYWCKTDIIITLGSIHTLKAKMTKSTIQDQLSLHIQRCYKSHNLILYYLHQFDDY